jgi:hypothetical protein
VNEKIKQLAEQAGLRFTQRMSNPMVSIVDGKETDLEKFAELIVERCMALCDGNHEYKNHADTEFGKGVAMGIYLSKNMIKQHFGEKE